MTAIHQLTGIPPRGEAPEAILKAIRTMKKEDAAWQEGRTWSLVYYADEAHDQLLKAAAGELFSANYLNPLAFKSLHRMEQEVVHMTAAMLHGRQQQVGVMTSGGTESILLAMFTYRQRAAKLHSHITAPEVIVPETIHPAFDKAALLFGLKLHKAPVDEARRVRPEAMEALINKNTILLAVSAPSYPNGVLDPVEAVAEVALRHQLPLHVDACIGGFMLPWLEKLGYELPRWDFRVKGVTSISADVHKFGFGAKGASVLTYQDMDYLRHQFVVTTDYPGGIYISPTLLGTRAGGPIAAAWAGMKHLGETGYLALAQKLMAGAEKLRAGLQALPGIRIVGEPCMNLISYTTVENRPDIFVIADQLEEKGWVVERQQFPDCIHLTVLPTNVGVIDQYLTDLATAYDYALAHPEAIAQGSAAVYGLMARLPFRGMVEKSVKKIMEDMYGVTEPETGDANAKMTEAVNHSPAWMGLTNRLLSGLSKWKHHFKRIGHPIRFWLILILVISLAYALQGQPFVDPLQIRYTIADRNDSPGTTPESHLWAGSDLPIKLKEKTYLLISPYYEQWGVADRDQLHGFARLQSLALPVGLILPMRNDRWSLTLMPMLRSNGEKLLTENTFQLGGVVLVGYARKPQQQFRAGLYVNQEFFGLFVVSLLGTDWRIDQRNYLFGTLPGRLAFEHQWSGRWYGGASFRAPTNSYRLPTGEYIRIDDNQLSLYADFYALQNWCLTLELGGSMMRRVQSTPYSSDGRRDIERGIGPFVRLSTAYRIRL